MEYDDEDGEFCRMGVWHADGEDCDCECECGADHEYACDCGGALATHGED
jgi:hypothetical protein